MHTSCPTLFISVSGIDRLQQCRCPRQSAEVWVYVACGSTASCSCGTVRARTCTYEVGLTSQQRSGLAGCTRSGQRHVHAALLRHGLVTLPRWQAQQQHQRQRNMLSVFRHAPRGAPLDEAGRGDEAPGEDAHLALLLLVVLQLDDQLRPCKSIAGATGRSVKAWPRSSRSQCALNLPARRIMGYVTELLGIGAASRTHCQGCIHKRSTRICRLYPEADTRMDRRSLWVTRSRADADAQCVCYSV